MTALLDILDTFRKASQSEREKGTYFEHLVKSYLLNEPSYKDLFNGQVYLWEEWRTHWMKLGNPDPGVDAGIDLVAVEDISENARIFAIQAKFYAADAKLSKGSGIDSFLSAMGKHPYTNGLLFLTTSQASKHVTELMKGRDKPVNIVTLTDLEGSQIDWSQYKQDAKPVLHEKKSLRPHQETALKKVRSGLETADRGKLIMACGTGKTFTGLKIAEALAGKGKRVLFLVPSLSLLSQTLTEWTQESGVPLHSFAVCSDSDVGKKRRKDDDSIQTYAHELRYPATTNAKSLATAMDSRHDDNHMSVVYSTYHSIDVLSQAQKEHNLPSFDLIICDEAHRTTGATFEGDEESHFVKVHDNDFLKAAKRLYMTATPRIFGDAARATAEQDNVALYSMDNEQQYGKELHVITFSEAVKRGLLVDYKVIVLAVEESHVSRRIQGLLKDDDNQLKVDDAAKIIGCWKALSKQGMTDDLSDDGEAMKRAVAFCQVIEQSGKGKTHKVASKDIANMFQAVVESYQESAETDDEISATLHCEAEHIDGGMNASEKETKLSWLKAETPEDTCRILSNVRCLSEGVDVPALDAVLFLTPRNSQVDVVQSVGRVMRTVKDKDGNDLKKRGYIVLPVVIPAGVEPHEALNDNKTYKVVWQVLQALRSHDDRFDAMVNKLDLIGKDPARMEVVAVTDKIQKKAPKPTKKQSNVKKAKNGTSIGNAAEGPPPEQEEMEFEIGEIERAIYAKLVQKVGNRHHWEDWANDIAKIARTHIDRIQGILENPENSLEQEAFKTFSDELRDDLNDSIPDGEIVEMLAQHLITKPVFDALFEGYDFAKQNPMSLAMQAVLDSLHEHHLKKEADTLEQFYENVRMRASGIDNAAGKQRIIVELYDKFFKNAFPRMTDRLGIVYTPVEVVDFILHSVNHLLQKEFGQTVGSKGVHIVDPFTGTGTFITRLLQSGLIKPEELTHKYQNEIHANEIVLLAYYIAAINIEAVYHDLVGGDYQPFQGICLTDTFQMYEKDDLVDDLLVDNSERRMRQKALDIRVIVGNPPYSIGQGSENDNNGNVGYPMLDERIRSTYVQRSSATLSKGLYDSYVRAIRWASDRIGDAGVVGFVTNSGFLEKSAMSGFRRCLHEEFSNIYILNLRGDIRKNMLSKGRAKEGQNIFGSGSMAGIAISILVKNPQANEHGCIYYHNIGDDLSTEEKLDKIGDYASTAGIEEWKTITPDAHGDWLSQRDDGFREFMALGDKKTDEPKLFDNFSLGVVTNRDAWAYNASKSKLRSNMGRMIDFYNSEVRRFNQHHSALSKKERDDAIGDFVDANPERISWTRSLKKELSNNRMHHFETASVVQSLYRPFTKSWMYFNRRFNEMVYQMPRIFPDAETENLVICAAGTGARSGFSVNITNRLPDLQAMDNGQCFPLYLYDEAAKKSENGNLFGDQTGIGKMRRDAITDDGLEYFKNAYPSENLSKEDLFYYVYGVLHSLEYRERFADNLSKELPRIPAVKQPEDFWAFSKAGRELAELHLNYETVDPYPATIEVAGKKVSLAKVPADDCRIEKMKFAKSKHPETGKSVNDLSCVIYNNRITVTDIPVKAWEYVVNGKPALSWVMERQAVTTHKASGIVNDANDWAIETMGNPKYPLELFLRVITVSLETMKIVNGLPKLDIK